MNNRSVIVLVVILLFITIIIGLRFLLQQDEPILIVYLRCDNNVSGILSITSTLGSDEHKKNFDLKTSCRSGRINFNKYSDEKILKWIFKSEYSNEIKFNSEYGFHIQRDKDGFYLVLKITKVPPFIVNDQI